ncbi:MAG: flotillin-like protein FloA [Gemmatimonadetes bacterium]|nr:flotillin-like protein FloA [Gemmatimonadota bacterium]
MADDLRFGGMLFIIFIAILLLIIITRFVPIGLWLQALFSNVRVPFSTLFFMRFRRVNPARIVNPLITATKAGLPLRIDALEAHFLAGGNVERVVAALIAADKANIDLTFQQATAIDLAGRDVLEAVQTSVNPKVINTPRVAAMAKDGIQLIAVARVTVRANINRLVGGAGEDTILARVGEGIVSTIGSSAGHKAVLENPDSISKSVLAKGLDAGTAYEILSIDIADVDVGKNIGAELQTDQAEADKRIAQAKAEERRAMAVAVEQENRARVEEMRAKVVEAEAEIPMAMADAFRSGNLGIMDYARYRNLQSDTAMRDSIAKPDGGGRDVGQNGGR